MINNLIYNTKHLAVAVMASVAFIACTPEPVHAMGVEEVCNMTADTDARLHQKFKQYPELFEIMLEKSKEDNKKDPEFQASLRERLFWIKNRLSMPNEDIRMLSFIDCKVRVLKR